jgi:hypothetical protein
MATDIRHQPENGYNSEPTQPSLRENLNKAIAHASPANPNNPGNLGVWPYGSSAMD